MNRRFTKEELVILADFEDRFHSAMNYGYARNCTNTKLKAIQGTYNLTTDKPLNSNFSCSHCVLELLRVVGKKYYEDKAFYEAEAAKLVEVLDEVFEDVPDENKAPKKRGRKPKVENVED